MKTCCKCKKEKEIEDFHKDRTTKDGRSYKCKECKQWKNLPENIRQAQRDRANEWNARNPRKMHSAHFKRKYGLTLEQWEEMAEKQNYKCAICQEEETGKRLSVDHCHTTGKIRQLLCQTCNMGIGAFKEKPELFHSALAYMEKHRGEFS